MFARIWKTKNRSVSTSRILSRNDSFENEMLDVNQVFLG